MISSIYLDWLVGANTPSPTPSKVCPCRKSKPKVEVTTNRKNQINGVVGTVVVAGGILASTIAFPLVIALALVVTTKKLANF